jgi:MYXO-CTERM domain-containing protein
VAPALTEVHAFLSASDGFVPGGGELVLAPTSAPMTASLQGTNLSNFTILGDVLFEPNIAEPFVVAGAFTARGTAEQSLALRSSIGEEPWTFRVVDEDLVDVDFVSVSDSHHVGAFLIDPPRFVDEGNTRGWKAGVAAACGALVARSGLVVLASDADVVAFNGSGVQCIDGDLTIAAGVTTAAIEQLRVVTGAIAVEGTGLTALSAPQLTRVGDLRLIDNAALASLDLSALDRVDGDLLLQGSPALVDVDLTDLSRVGGDLILRDLGTAAVDLTELDAVGGDLVITDNVALEDLDIGVRAVGGDLVISNNDLLGQLSLVVVIVDGSVLVQGNDGLAALILQLLQRVGGNVAIADNDGLEEADLGALANVGGDLSIDADDINVGSLQSVGGTTTLVGDDLTLPDDLACDAAGNCAPPAELDTDADGVIDGVDNCGTIANSDQRDSDGDRVGDVCDRDDDDDGIADDDDADPLVAVAGPDDTDGDGVRDDLDGCPDNADIAQVDPDGDGRGAVCDDDSDGDGIANADDPCPLVVGSGCFDDADGDGIANADDSCPTQAGTEDDGDGDGLGDGCDSDADGDDASDLIDVCPGLVDDQADADDDGFGDACDPCPDTAGTVGGCPVVVGVAPIAREPPDPRAPDATQGCTCAAASSADVGAGLIALAALFGWRRRRRLGGLAGFGAIVLLMAGPSLAETRTWTGAVDSSWSEPGNWAPAGVPGVDDDLIIASSGAIVRVDTGTPVASLAVDAGAVIIEVVAFNAGALRIDGGVFLADTAEVVTADVVTLDAGVLSAPLDLRVGQELRLRGGFVSNGGVVSLTPATGVRVGVDLVDATLADLVIEGDVDVDFAPGSRLTTNGLLRVVGDAGGRASLAGVGGQRWSLDARGAVEVDVIRVADCENIGFLISPPDFEDGGNNVGWGLPPSLCAERATLVGSYVLLSDDDVLAFEDTGVECLVGDLVIGGGVTRLALTTLEVVIGRIIVRNSAVEDIALDALVQAAGLEVEASPALAGISAPVLAAVDADLALRDDPGLVTVEFPALENVGGDLILENNDAVLTLALPLGAGVGRDLILDDCDAIETFSSDVANIGGDLIVTSNDSLTTLSMPSLQNVGGDLVIIDNDELIDVEMDALASVGGDLICNDNDSLPLLLMDLLGELGGSVLLVGNDSLGSVALDNLPAIAADLFVVDNPALVSLLMSNLASIGDDLTVLGNLQLVVLSLPTLQNIGGDLVIAENPQLQTFSVPALTTVGGNLVIVENPLLDDIDLSALSSCGGDLIIKDNAELCITDCESLSDVGGELIIAGEPVLPPGVRCGADGRCGPIFGDGLIVLIERCDDANESDDDGCTRGELDSGYRCAPGEPTVCERDVDSDQVVDLTDRCPDIADADQTNTDGDPFGDACDSDDDNDGVADERDSCPLVPNADQQDVPCDAIAASTDDRDNDGVLDVDDLCPDVPDAAQADTDNDGVGDGCDGDDDDDALVDGDDPCPLIAGACAGDADGDGVADGDDLCPTLTAATDDADADGLGDACDSDDDGDGVPDVRDGCPLSADPGQQDEDGDGFGDACDRCPGDDDNDTDTACGPIVPESPAAGGCSASGGAAPLPALATVLLFARRRRSDRPGRPHTA